MSNLGTYLASLDDGPENEIVKVEQMQKIQRPSVNGKINDT